MSYSKPAKDYFVSLVRSQVRHEVPAEKPDDVKWSEILRMASGHKLDVMIGDAVKQLKKQPEGSDKDAFVRIYNKHSMIDILQKEESNIILSSFTEAGIAVLPLKGTVLKEFYDKTETRQMGDIDVLVRPEDIEKCRPIMENLGYEAEDVGLEDSHDVYVKKPYLVVEIHRRLLPPTEENHWYTDDIWDRLVPRISNPLIMDMLPEDLYLYHLLHFEKHYSMGGSGIRFVIDHYYIRKKLRLNEAYISDYIEKMNYLEFEEMCDDLSAAWFENGRMTPELMKKADFIIGSGVYGGFEQLQEWMYQQAEKKFGVKSSRQFFFRRMFMERERMEFSYPILKRHGWLLPFCWIHRLFKALFSKRDRIKKEIETMKKREDKSLAGK